MGTGAITQYIDVAQVVLYMFWIFFFWLVVYLTLESKREGFPIEHDRPDGSVRREVGFLPMPSPKVYKTKFHGDFVAPHERDFEDPMPPGKAIGPFPGMPLEPTGDPMKAAGIGIGPGAYTRRMDVTDKTWEGHDKIVPLRTDAHFGVAKQDLDPRGLTVLGADNQAAGQVVDVWVDRSEHMIRYLEVKTQGGRTALLPMNFCRVRRDRIKGNRVTVESILAGQFEGVPSTAHAEKITLLEEEKIMAYFGAGTLFATPSRREPLV
jgi:photosynthetic reaction center H subunit